MRRLLIAASIAQLGALGPGCSATTPRPPGVPDTPYWFIVGDSTFWYEPEDSLALVQFSEGTGGPAMEERLYDLRELGWRMTPLRGPALQRGGQEQSLSQYLFQVEKVPGAMSPVENRREFDRRFWSSRGSASEPLKGILPGLRPFGQAPTRYYWPNCVTITWSDLLTASQAEDWLEERGCSVLTAKQLVNQYYLQRTWVAEIPTGARLFEWLRKLNSDPAIESAYPVGSLREPPSPDPRDPRLITLSRTRQDKSAPRPENCSEDLWQAYRIAHFAGNAAHVVRGTVVPVQGAQFKVLMFTKPGAPADDSALVLRYGGRVLSMSGARVEAWIPYVGLPELSRESRVVKLDAASR